MLSELSQTQKDKNSIISLICKLFKKKKKSELIDTEKRLVVARGGERVVGKMSTGS